MHYRCRWCRKIRIRSEIHAPVGVAEGCDLLILKHGVPITWHLLMTSHESQNHPVSVGSRSEGKMRLPLGYLWIGARHGISEPHIPEAAVPEFYPHSGLLMHARRIPAVAFQCPTRHTDHMKDHRWQSVVRCGRLPKDIHLVDRID